MIQQDAINELQKGLFMGLLEGGVTVPYMLLKTYHKLKLTEAEVMLLIQLIGFKEKEQNDFPTIDEIQARMTATPQFVDNGLQKLMKRGMISIDEVVDSATGMHSERYNLNPVLEKIAALYTEEHVAALKSEMEAAAAAEELAIRTIGQAPHKAEKDIFTIFEKEFARPLSPMECETISSWLDKDQYAFELIFAALKEAVFAGKVHFRYIDRILLEWSRNRVFTAEQAREYNQKFRDSR